MNELLLQVLTCPACRKGPLEYGKEQLACKSCKATYAVRDGVPRMLKEQLAGDELQSQQSFSDKWSKAKDYAEKGSKTEKFQHEWYLRRYGWKAESDLKEFLKGKKLILDAGTGLGRDTLWYHELSGNPVVSLDISTAIDTVREKFRSYSGINPVQGDILELPVQNGAFDFVACDQVLSNIADPRRGLARLVDACKPGGHVAFYLYKKKGPIREFTDDFIRSKVTKLEPEPAWEISRKITRFAESLAKQNVTIEVPEDIEILELKAGKHDLQRFFFYEIFKMFWNDEFTFDQNVLVNHDWYHPAFTFRYTPEEVRTWANELNLDVVHLDLEDRSAISVLAKKR